MKTSELIPKIGTIMELPLDGLVFLVEIRDFRHAYGRVDALVSPVAGKGERHFSLASLRKTNDSAD